MSLVLTGIVPLPLGLVLVLGANAGSAIIPMALTALEGGPARRIPFGNLVFRTLGVLLALPFIDLAIPHLQQLDGSPARQVANFHTAFNLALAAVFLPFTELMAKAATRLFPAAPAEDDEGRPRHLDAATIEQPAVALGCATRETMRMADVVERMLRGVIVVFRDDDEKLLAEISRLDDAADSLHDAIKLYLTQVSRQALPEAESRRCVELIIFTTNLEHVGDIIDKNLLELAQKKIRKQLTFSEQGWQEIVDMHERVVHQMQLAMSVFVSGDVATARQLIVEKERFRELERKGSEHHFERLRMGRIESIDSSALHLDILRDLKRINSHLTSVAYPIVDAEGELRRSRLKAPPADDRMHAKTS
jgi:phosphate:Na+ symporter